MKNFYRFRHNQTHCLCLGLHQANVFTAILIMLLQPSKPAAQQNNLARSFSFVRELMPSNN